MLERFSEGGDFSVLYFKYRNKGGKPFYLENSEWAKRRGIEQHSVFESNSK